MRCPAPVPFLLSQAKPALYLGGRGRGWVHKHNNSPFSLKPSLFDHSFYVSSFLCEQNLKCQSKTGKTECRSFTLILCLPALHAAVVRLLYTDVLCVVPQRSSPRVIR